METGQLKRQVRRNIERFPEDFMFDLSKEEYREFLRCQIGIIEQGKYSKYSAMAFTEQGVAMLSSVLNSKRAIQVNIQIMRTFTKLRRMIYSHDELRKKVESLEKKYDEQFRIVFDAIKQLIKTESGPVKKIGYKIK